MKDIWKKIKGFDNYKINNKGDLINIKTNKILKKRNKNGYFAYVLYNYKIKKDFLSHRLVAEYFIPNPDNKPQVNHINGFKTDNRVENLEWVTAYENITHAMNTGLTLKCDKHAMCKLSNNEILEIRHLYFNKVKNQVELSKLYNVRQCHISRIIRNEQRML